MVRLCRTRHSQTVRQTPSDQTMSNPSFNCRSIQIHLDETPKWRPNRLRNRGRFGERRWRPPVPVANTGYPESGQALDSGNDLQHSKRQAFSDQLSAVRGPEHDRRIGQGSARIFAWRKETKN